MRSQNMFDENKWTVFSNISGEPIGEIEITTSGVYAKSKAYLSGGRIRFEGLESAERMLERADENFHNRQKKEQLGQQAPTLF